VITMWTGKDQILRPPRLCEVTVVSLPLPNLREERDVHEVVDGPAAPIDLVDIGWRIGDENTGVTSPFQFT